MLWSVAAIENSGFRRYDSHMTPIQSSNHEPSLVFFHPSPAVPRVFPYFEVGVSAGFPSPADDHLQKGLDLNEHLVQHPAATFFAHVRGDSMRDANLNDGDLLIIDRALEAVHGNIVVAIFNGEFAVKRLHRKNGEIRLLPENPLYPVIEITDGMDFEIWGVVSHIIHRAK